MHKNKKKKNLVLYIILRSIVLKASRGVTDLLPFTRNVEHARWAPSEISVARSEISCQENSFANIRKRWAPSSLPPRTPAARAIRIAFTSSSPIAECPTRHTRRLFLDQTQEHISAATSPPPHPRKKKPLLVLLRKKFLSIFCVAGRQARTHQKLLSTRPSRTPAARAIVLTSSPIAWWPHTRMPLLRGSRIPSSFIASCTYPVRPVHELPEHTQNKKQRYIRTVC